MKNRVALCAIAKNENRYIREWVEYYKSIGVTHIFLYDNNDEDGERFEEVINDYIDNGFVEIIDVRGIWIRNNLQVNSYVSCYNNHKNEYDWMMFFDIDEFLTSPSNKNIIEYINDPKFDIYDTILVNWVYYGDNNEVLYRDAPVMERFKTIVDPRRISGPAAFRTGYQCKSIVRCGKNTVLFDELYTLHKFILEGAKVCNSNALEDKYVKWYMLKPAFDNLVLNHYITKSLLEFFDKYLFRGWDSTCTFSLVCSWYKVYNDWTSEKSDYFNKLKNQYLNKIIYFTDKKLEETTNYDKRGLHVNMFTQKIISHTFQTNRGIIEFDGPVTCIGNRAFYKCDITFIALPDYISYIGTEAFYGCNRLYEIKIPDNTKHIGISAFLSCTNLVHFWVNECLNIGAKTFHGCNSIKYLELTKLDTVSRELCSWNTKLDTIVLKSTTKKLEDFILYRTDKLKTLICYAATPPTCSINTFKEVNNNITIKVPMSSIELYKLSPEWNKFKNYESI